MKNGKNGYQKFYEGMNRRMMKKSLIFLLAACVCLTAGCSSSKKETEAPAKAETEAAAAAKEAASEAAAAAEEAVSEAAEAVEEAATEAAGILGAAADTAEEAVSEAAEVAEEAASEAEEAVKEAATEAEEVLGAAADTAEEAVSEAAEVAEEAASEAEEAVKEAATEAEEVLGAAADTAEEAVSEAAEVTEEAVSEAAEVTEEAASEAAEAVEEAATEAAEAASEAEEAVKEAATEAEEALGAAVEAASEAAEMVEEAEEETAAVESALEEGTEENALEEETEESLAEEETEGPAQIVELGERPQFVAKDYVTVGAYKDLLAEVTKTEISDADVDGELEIDVEMAVEEKELFEKETEGTIAEGDIVNIDYEGKIDGVAFDGGTGNYDLEIGSGSFIEGFEDQLIGVKIGDTTDLNVTFPENYTESLAGKDAVFTVTANYIRKEPALTDELISKVTDGEYTTIDGYRAHEKEKLEKEAEDSQKSEAYSELMQELYNTFTINSLPEDLVDYSLKSARNQNIEMAQMYGMTYEDLLTMYGMDDETFMEYLKSDIEASLKQEMILKAIAEEENITVSEEEYKEGVQKYADAYGFESAEKFEEAYKKSDIESSLLMNKVIEFVYDNAVIKEIEPETEDLELDLLEAGTEEAVYEEEETEATT